MASGLKSDPGASVEEGDRTKYSYLHKLPKGVVLCVVDQYKGADRSAEIAACKSIKAQ